MALPDLIKRLVTNVKALTSKEFIEQSKKTASSKVQSIKVQKQLESIPKKTVKSPIVDLSSTLKKVTGQPVVTKPIYTPPVKSDYQKKIEAEPTISGKAKLALGETGQSLKRGFENPAVKGLFATLKSTVDSPDTIAGLIMENQPRQEGESLTKYINRVKQGSDVIAEKIGTKYGLPPVATTGIALGLGLLTPGIGDVGKGKKVVEEVTEGIGGKVVSKSSADLFNEGIERMSKKDKFAQTQLQASEVGRFLKPEGLVSKTKSELTPLKYVDDTTKDIYTKWSRKNLVSDELANQEVSKLPIPEKQGLDTLLKYEAGEYTPYTEKIKTAFDDLFNEANERGIKVEYRSNYLPQVYSNTPEEVQTALFKFLKDKGVPEQEIIDYLTGKSNLSGATMKTLNLNPSFAKQRAFPDYKTAMEYGLRPKYTHPAQLVADYRATLEKTINNRELLDNLVQEGKILPAGLAPATYKAINLPFSPQGYYAEPKVADLINGIFKSESTLTAGEELFKITADLSRKAQEIALSAGVPKTDLNFWSFGQVIKEVTGGNFKALVPLIRGNFTDATIKYFEKKQSVIRAMSEEGIDIGSRIGSYGNVYKNLIKDPNLLRVVGKGFDNLFNEKTFSAFMPQLYIQTFEDAFKKGVSKGMNEAQAKTFAGNVTKNWMGLIGDVGRSKVTQDKLSSIFFAPKFRESLINSWANNLRSIAPNNLLNPEFYRNRRLIGGMVVSYGLYNLLNKELSGHYMWENPPGKEFDLQIPIEGEDNAFVGFMPSYLAFARNIASGTIATVKGDLKTAGQKFGSLFSMPIKITAEILSNRDYFGRPIYNDDDSWPDKAKKMASYLGMEVNHPYITETIKYLKGDKPLYQAISEGLELPLKFMNDQKIANSEFYNAMDVKDKERLEFKKTVQPKYDEIQSLSLEGKEDEAKAKLSLLTDQEYEVYKDIKASDKRKKTNARKALVYPKYKQIQDLASQGKMEEAKVLLSSLTDEEYKAYKYLKDTFSE